jgi:hypothetical protein
MRPFSKLKKQIESLFDSNLKMTFNCTSYAIGHHNAIPRFYVRLGKDTIWDFPKDIVVKDLDFHWWSNDLTINDLVREYIDTPVDKLLSIVFENETAKMTNYDDYSVIEFNLNLTPLFIAADRRLGKEKLLAWAADISNPNVNKILDLRFGKQQNKATK